MSLFIEGAKSFKGHKSLNEFVTRSPLEQTLWGHLKLHKNAIVTNSHVELPYVQIVSISLMDHVQEAGGEFSWEGESSLNN